MNTKELEIFEYISFDIFDTLIKRNIKNELIDIIEKLKNKKYTIY